MYYIKYKFNIFVLIVVHNEKKEANIVSQTPKDFRAAWGECQAGKEETQADSHPGS